jgi:hypothetical protein
MVSETTNVNKGIPVTTQKNRGTVRHGDFYPGRMAAIKGSAIVTVGRNIKLNSTQLRTNRCGGGVEYLYRDRESRRRRRKGKYRI